MNDLCPTNKNIENVGEGKMKRKRRTKKEIEE